MPMPVVTAATLKKASECAIDSCVVRFGQNKILFTMVEKAFASDSKPPGRFEDYPSSKSLYIIMAYEALAQSAEAIGDALPMVTSDDVRNSAPAMHNIDGELLRIAKANPIYALFMRNGATMLDRYPGGLAVADKMGIVMYKSLEKAYTRREEEAARSN